MHNGQPVKNLLQYALTPNADTSPRIIQVEAGGGAVYIDVPDGRVFRLQGSATGTWNQIK